jgi:hypothetical protein
VILRSLLLPAIQLAVPFLYCHTWYLFKKEIKKSIAGGEKRPPFCPPPAAKLVLAVTANSKSTLSLPASPPTPAFAHALHSLTLQAFDQTRLSSLSHRMIHNLSF